MCDRSLTVKCLLLIVPERIGRASGGGRRLRSTPADPHQPPVGVALLPQDFKAERPDICDLFRLRGLPVANSVSDLVHLDIPATGPRLDLLELSVDARSASVDPLTLFNIRGDNRQLVCLLFSPTAVRYRRRCCTSKYCTSLIDWDTCWGRSFLDRNNGAIIAYLIRLGVQMTHRDPTGGTLLHLAAKRGYDCIANCARAPYNLDPNAQDLIGRTPIFWAYEKQHWRFHDRLVRYGANMNHRDQNGQTVLHRGITLRYSTKVWQDVPNYDPNVADNLGQTPLILAAKEGFISVVRRLLDAGARIDVQDNEGNTPFHAALRSRHLNTFRFLLEYELTNLISALWTEVALLLDRRSTPNRGFGARAAKFFQEHLVKVLVLQDSSVSPNLWARFLGDASEFHISCLAEVAALEAEAVCIGISLLDVTRMRIGRLASLLRNGAAARRVRTTNLRRFPIYGNILKHKFNRGIRRKMLLRKGVNGCKALIPQFRSLPLEVWFNIVSCLSDRDLDVFER